MPLKDKELNGNKQQPPKRKRGRPSNAELQAKAALLEKVEQVEVEQVESEMIEEIKPKSFSIAPIELQAPKQLEYENVDDLKDWLPEALSSIHDRIVEEKKSLIELKHNQKHYDFQTNRFEIEKELLEESIREDQESLSNCRITYDKLSGQDLYKEPGISYWFLRTFLKREDRITIAMKIAQFEERIIMHREYLLDVERSWLTCLISQRTNKKALRNSKSFFDGLLEAQQTW